MSGRAKFERRNRPFGRPLMLPGKIIGKSWDLRFRALPDELPFIARRRVGRAESIRSRTRAKARALAACVFSSFPRNGAPI